MKYRTLNKNYPAWSQEHKITVKKTPVQLPPYKRHPCRDCAYYDVTAIERPSICARCNSIDLYAAQIESDGRPGCVLGGGLSEDTNRRSRSLTSKSSRMAQG